MNTGAGRRKRSLDGIHQPLRWGHILQTTMNDANDNTKDKHDGTYEDNEDSFADEDDDDKEADPMPDLVLDLDHLDYILYKAETESGKPCGHGYQSFITWTTQIVLGRNYEMV